MWKVSKEFNIPVGHRLSKHLGKCKNFHGHNFKIIVTVSSSQLNDNNMVIDFHDLSKLMHNYIDSYDHALVINACDEDKIICDIFKVIKWECDPTAEVFAQKIFRYLKEQIKGYNTIKVEKVTVYENEKSFVEYEE